MQSYHSRNEIIGTSVHLFVWIKRSVRIEEKAVVLGSAKAYPCNYYTNILLHGYIITWICGRFSLSGKNALCVSSVASLYQGFLSPGEIN